MNDAMSVSSKQLEQTLGIPQPHGHQLHESQQRPRFSNEVVTAYRYF
jgi:hypothetical protein